MTVCGVYALNNNQTSFIKGVLKVIPVHCLLITGDFNIITHLVNRPPSKDLSKELVCFLSAVTCTGFYDLAR